MWSQLFRSYGKSYTPPALKLFSGGVSSACGMASSATGPFYCPSDKTIYIDLGFYDQLRNQFGADGDFAQAYVLAHEVGHHVQNLVGVLPQFNRMRQSMGKLEGNQMSVKVELQADCFAGVWGHHAARRDLLEPGDVDEGLAAAAAIGDDRLQRGVGRRVVPET
ncbi:MAG TPA: neutral zinc metallopeptidase, partial [Lacipirellulaceae bacterium]|nr:neutral zinc metallopeptidase [Lacipirellulaceae bacterium]